MNKTRLKFTAQDRIIAAVMAEADRTRKDNPDLAEAICAEAIKLATKWGVQLFVQRKTSNE